MKNRIFNPFVNFNKAFMINFHKTKLLENFKIQSVLTKVLLMKNMTKKKKSLINKKKIWLRDKKYKTVKYRKNNILIVINNKNNINFPKIIV
jgi:hypothetical protein